MQQLIEDFQTEKFNDEFGNESNLKLLQDEAQNLSTPELKEIYKRKLKQRNSTVKRINRKSRVFIGDSFLKFHLMENLIFYLVLFTVPAMSVVDCVQGHSSLSYFAIGAYMMSVLVIDIVNLRYHISKELLKLELTSFYGKKQAQQQKWKVFTIYMEAICEALFTQLNLFDLYTDFCFLTIAYSETSLSVYFVFSLCSFVLTMIPKAVSMYYIFSLLQNKTSKSLNQDPFQNQNEPNSTVYDEDRRRKMVFRAFTYSEFRSQALCVDYINYEIYKTEVYMSFAKFLAEDLP